MSRMNEYQSSDFDRLKLAARKLHVRLPEDLEEIRMDCADWKTLHSIRSAARKAAQAQVKEIESAGDSVDLRSANRTHDMLLAIFDDANDEIELRDAHDTREPVDHVNPNRPDQSGEARGVPGGYPGEGVNGLEWRDRRGTPIKVLRPDQHIAEERGATGLQVGDIAKAMIYGPSNDAERRALSEGTDSAGGYTVPTRLASYFIDKLRAESVCFKAGAQTVPMDSDNLAIARVTGDPTVSWTAENAEITASDPTFDAVTLAPKKLACLVKVSRELLEDSVNIGAALEAAFTGRMSEEMDRALLFGSGSSNQPTGLFSISGINSVSMGTNGAALTNYDPLLDMQYEIAVDNGADPSAFIMHPRTRTALAKLKDGDNNPLSIPADLAGIARLSTTAVPINQTQGSSSVASTVLAGDFSKMLVGVRRSMELRMLNERYAEFDQVGFVATLRVDVAVVQPVHFCKLIGIIPAA